MVEQHNKRSFKKLRISLTNLCNLACSYCVPEHYLKSKTVPDIIDLAEGAGLNSASIRQLTPDELIKAVISLNKVLELSEIRLTGGEPLLYPQIINLIEHLSQLNIDKIGLTTNGFLLPLYAKKLKKAGLKSVNISLDAVDQIIYKQITKKDYLNRVLQGIDASIATGLKVKLNAVIMRGINTNQVVPLLAYAAEKNIELRFIELMKMGYLYNSDNSLLFKANEILKIIAQKYPVVEIGRSPSSTTRKWQLNTGQQFGIIANESFPFCSDCDRLRLDDRGRIFGCISSEKGFQITPFLDQIEKLEQILQKALSTKQSIKFTGSHRSMINVGG